MDVNLFTEEEVSNSFKNLEESYLGVEKQIDSIITKEKELNFPIKYDFVDNEGYINSGLVTLNDSILSLISIIYSQYCKLEVNNKIKSGLLSFEMGLKYWKDNNLDFTTEEKIEMAEKIRIKRNELFNSIGNIPMNEKEKEVKNFWRKYVYGYFYEKFPLFEYFIGRRFSNEN